MPKLRPLDAAPPPRHQYLPRSGSTAFGVDAYDLTLDYKVATNRLDAVAVIRMRALAPLDQIRLDLVHLKVRRASLAGDRHARWAQTASHVTLTPSAPIAAGETAELRIEYDGAPRPRRSRWGLIGWEELTDGVLVAGQPSGAPTWFPCNDRPDDKARYRIRLTCESAYMVVVNGTLTEQRQKGGKTTWTYVQDEPTSTYLATVQIGRYTSARRPAPFGTWTLCYPPALAKRVVHDFAPVDRMIEVFQSAFGPYPFPSYTVVVTKDDLEIPLEAQGMATFGSGHADGKHGADRLIAHELAHQWFGNSVGLVSWGDIWLNEGFACYAEWLWSEASGGLSADAQARAAHARLAGLPQDLLLGDPGPELMFDDRVYKRGACLLHALRLTLGDDMFFAIVRAWTAAHRHGSATAAEFCEHVASRSTVPVAPLFAAWLDHTPLPPLPAPTAA